MFQRARDAASRSSTVRDRADGSGDESWRAGDSHSRLRRALRERFAPRALLRRPPLWREGRWPLELATLLADPIFSGEGVPPGRGRPVLLIPGYLAGDSSLRLMARWLGRAGYHPAGAGMLLNADCAGVAIKDLERRLEHLTDRAGMPAVIIGQSRGGFLGRLLCARWPERCAALITLGSPHLDPLAVHPLVLLNVGVVGALGSLGIPGLFSRSCWRGGGCCRHVWDEARGELPGTLPFLSIYSRSDGIVDWRSCLDPAARHLHVAVSHLGMGVHPGVYRAIAEELRPIGA